MGRSQRSVWTSLPVSPSKVAAPTKRRAERVSTTSTSAPASWSLRVRKALL
jgi:hypothetical protein